VAGLLYGIKPAVVAIVLAAAWRIGKRSLKNGWLWAIAGLSFVCLTFLHLPFPAIVLGAALPFLVLAVLAWPVVRLVRRRYGVAAS